MEGFKIIDSFKVLFLFIWRYYGYLIWLLNVVMSILWMEKVFLMISCIGLLFYCYVDMIEGIKSLDYEEEQKEI